MKKLLISLSLLLLLTSPALALDATRSGRQIRDEKKQQILEHVNQQLNLINDRATKAMLNHLERLQALLNKIKVRVPTIDIVSAQAKIDETKAAVTAQADKEYVIEFTNESGLRVGASAAKTTLRADIKAVREKVRLARQTVVDLLKAAKSL
ncbi:hypothetical protein A3I57_01535 [Candidatus Beckwithbacteria bacterium RIFCSPLOWO2_02_FULL_47_23]|uniref:DUF5667 domain-containing protein n=1 Tax=Candidatus Beckwithbacteria bacterium RIFCSPLOWO2_02_FULL_47_23 TaxID=1797463 RepID=A0A1F5E0A0_9BACT|nr:MAG: hypothetical protein A3I57_01535 [Candidatus Beckwithbacteria bacterium RIFCSPLOWO2_02_FULL_47_23]